MKTIRFLKFFLIGFIALGVSAAGFAFLSLGVSYGANAQITHKTTVENNGNLIKVLIKILNKAGNNEKAVADVESSIGVNNAGLKPYMKKGGFGDAVFLKLVADNALNKTAVKHLINVYTENNNAVYRLNGNDVNVKNVIEEMNKVCNLKVVNEVYRTATGVTVSHTLSLAVNAPATTHNLKLENYMTNEKGNVYKTHTLQNQINQVNNNTQQQIQQTNNTQRQMQQMTNTQQQMQQMTNTQRQMQQMTNTQRQMQQMTNTQRQMQQMTNTQQQIQQTNNMQQQMMGR